MDFKDKTFRDNKTGELIKVIDSFENIAILENKEKIDTRRLMNPTLYTEQIDPKSFFNSQSNYNALAEKIKNIPIENIRDEDGETRLQIQTDSRDTLRPDTDDVAVIMSSEEEERAELARKYNTQIDNTGSLKKQNESFAKYLDEEGVAELPKVNTFIHQPVSQGSSTDIQRIEVDRRGNQQIVNEPTKIVIDDPIISLFKKTKRTVDFSISIDIDNKIPRLDFIEMMEESYEMSIIDFLAEDFTENLLKNPRIIRNMIREKIKEMVYRKEINKSVKKPTPPSSEIIKEGQNPNPKKKRESKKIITPLPPPPPPPCTLIRSCLTPSSAATTRLLKEDHEPPKPNK